MNFDQQQAILIVIGDEYLKHFDAWLPLAQTLLDIVTRKVGRRLIVGRKDQAFEVAAKGRPHQALAILRSQDNVDRFLNPLYA